MNLLILSCGTRDKVVQYFKKAFTGEGRIVCTDASPYAPALYEGDAHYIVPRITEPGYMDIILDICRKENITGVLSLIDPELSLIALHKNEFEALGTTVIGSSYELCERTLNKWALYQWMCEHGYACVRSYIDLEAFYQALEQGEVQYPVFVKPSKAGSSQGVNQAKDREELQAALLEAAKHDTKILVEETIKGREIECAVLGGKNVKASDVGEIKAADTFYTYEAKYNNPDSKTDTHPELPEGALEKVREDAVAIFKAVDGFGLSRVDFFLEHGTNEVIFNEINTLPGFTNISMYPMLWREKGIDTTELVTELIELAFERK